MFTLELRNEAETGRFASGLARCLKRGDVLCLEGDLGAGKTVFARALINSLLESPEDVPSPTFTLVQTYDAPDFPIWHFDLYRLEDPEEVYELGWEEALGHAVLLIEWPSRISGFLPQDRLELELIFGEDENARTIRLAGHGEWEARLKELEL